MSAWPNTLTPTRLASIIKWISRCSRSTDVWLNCYFSLFCFLPSKVMFTGFFFILSDKLSCCENDIWISKTTPVTSSHLKEQPGMHCFLFQYGLLAPRSIEIPYNLHLWFLKLCSHVWSIVLEGACSQMQSSEVELRLFSKVWNNRSFHRPTSAIIRAVCCGSPFVSSDRFYDGSCRHCFLQCKIFPRTGFVILH